MTTSSLTREDGDVRNIAFYRKTRRGGFIKIVRELYLRPNIPCGSKFCSQCTGPKCLDDLSAGNNGSLTYYLLDTNVILQNIDVIEDPLISNVIIAQTVVNEVRHRSLPVFKRLKDLIGEKRKFHVFMNEFCNQTYENQEQNESVNDFKDRLIRNTVAYYNSHLSQIRTILISNDAENCNKATQMGLEWKNLKSYISDVNPLLLDKLGSANIDYKSTNAAIYENHQAITNLKSGIKSGRLVQGNFQASRYNPFEGHVFLEDKQVFIHGRSNVNRACQDDVVAIEMLPESEWKSANSGAVEEEDDDNEESTSQKDLKNQEVQEPKKKRKRVADVAPCAKVVGIIKRAWRPLCGALEKSVVTSGSSHLFKPADSRYPKVRIETRQYDTLLGQRIIVVVDAWPKDSKYPIGHYIRSLGKIGEKNTENEVLLLEHDVPHQPFSDNVLACLPKLPWIISEEDRAKRMDLTGYEICSVDPPGCTDIDDALHCRDLGNGLFEVGVHIADVSHFIRPGTALDDEAKHRCTSVYLSDKRIDMVPTLLSSNLCSLREQVERFAFSVIWKLDADANIQETKCTKSIIKSRRAFTYQQAQLLIDDTTQQTELAKSLRALNNLAKKLKAKRLEQGALLLASPEIRFHIDSETHDPIEVKRKELMETNSMVEEFMLLANITTAKITYENFAECACLRRHPSPPISNFDGLIKAAKSKGVEIRATSAKELARSFDKIGEQNLGKLDILLRIIATRCMMQAVYFATAFVPAADFVHYGLAIPIYTHFTSPIRRYADIIVHRLLAVVIDADVSFPSLLDPKKTQAICNTINYRHRMAQYASRASVALHTELYFRSRVENRAAHVLMVRKNAIILIVMHYGLEAPMHFPKDVPVTFDEEEPSVTVAGHKFFMLDELLVEISVDRSDEQHPKIMLKLVEPVVPGLSVPKLPEGQNTSPTKEPPENKKSKNDSNLAN